MSTLSVMLASLAGLTLAPAAELPSEDSSDPGVGSFISHPNNLLADDGVSKRLRQSAIARPARVVCREPGNPLRSRMGREARVCIAEQHIVHGAGAA
jgi:hypothetical protein